MLILLFVFVLSVVGSEFNIFPRNVSTVSTSSFSSSTILSDGTVAAAVASTTTPVPGTTNSSSSITQPVTTPAITSLDPAAVSSFIECVQGTANVCNRNYGGATPDYLSRVAIEQSLGGNPYDLGALQTTSQDWGASICSVNWTSSLHTWLATAPFSATLTNEIDTTTSNSAIQTTTVVAGDVEYVSTFDWVPITPCCSSCTVFGGSIGVCAYISLIIIISCRSSSKISILFCIYF